MKNKKKNTSGQRFLPLAIMVMIGVFCGLALPNALDPLTVQAETLGDFLLAYLVFLVSVFAAFLFQVIVHEGGHLVFGLLSGYRFCSFRIFSLMWVKEQGKLKTRRLSLAGTAGQCLMAPPDMVDGKIPVFLYNMGGSIMNGIFMAIFFGLYMALKPFPVPCAVMLVFAMIGLVLGLSNAIPMRTELIANDGYNAISLSKDPQALRAFWVQMKVVEQTAMGIRIKDMPPEWFEIPSDEAMKNSMVATVGVFACSRLMDENRLEEARALMERLLSAKISLSGIHRNIMINDLIFIETVGENRPEVIQSMLTKEFLAFRKSMAAYPTVLRTQYACALITDRDSQKAAQLKRQFEKAAKKYPYPCELEQEYEFLQLAEQKAQLN